MMMLRKYFQTQIFSTQIFVDTLEKNVKEIYTKFKFPKKYDNDHARQNGL